MGILDKQKERERQKIEQQKKLEEQKRIEKEWANKKKALKTATDLSEDELRYLIKVIARTKFEGLEMQIIYNITAKLQNQLKNKAEWGQSGKK